MIAAKEIFGKFGKAKNLLVEDFLIGEEMSYFVICDGVNYQFIELHKTISVWARETKVKIQGGWVVILH